jgi:hypothetical protein
MEMTSDRNKTISANRSLLRTMLTSDPWQGTKSYSAAYRKKIARNFIQWRTLIPITYRTKLYSRQEGKHGYVDETISNAEPYAITGKARRRITSWTHAQYHTTQALDWITLVNPGYPAV